jgi:hypothetical protein
MDTRITTSVESWRTARISIKLATLRRYRPRLLTTRSILDFIANSCNNQLYSTLWHLVWKYHFHELSRQKDRGTIGIRPSVWNIMMMKTWYYKGHLYVWWKCHQANLWQKKCTELEKQKDVQFKHQHGNQATSPVICTLSFQQGVQHVHTSQHTQYNCCQQPKFHLFLIYNPTFLWPLEELQTTTLKVSGFTYTIRQFVVFCQYSCEGILMKVGTATETCR